MTATVSPTTTPSPPAPRPATGGPEQLREIPLVELHPHPLNRKHSSPAKLQELASSLAKAGVLVPLLVRPHTNGYQILAGHRRHKAAKLVPLATVPCRIRTLSDAEALEVLVIENLQREDVHPLEEAEGYAGLLKCPGYDVATVATKVGKSESYVYARLKLVGLIEPARKAFFADTITAGHAILMARLTEKDQALALKHATERFDPMSVRELGRWIHQEILCELDSASFKRTDATLAPAAGPCTACPKRTGLTPELFADLEPGKGTKDRCLDPTCFQEKTQLQLARTKAAVAAEAVATGAQPGVQVLELSTSYHATGKGVLGSDRWREVKKTDPKAQPAIVVEGHTIGITKWVTTEKVKATTSRHQETWQVADRKRQEKAKQKAERRRRILEAVRVKLPGELSRVELQAVVGGYIREMHYESKKHLAGLLGVEPKKSNDYGNSDYETPIGSHVTRLPWAGQVRVLLTLPLIGDHYGRNVLLEAAKRYKVNVPAIDRAIAAELAAKKKAKAVKAPAGKSGKKK